jgi:hypothetical protein
LQRELGQWAANLEVGLTPVHQRIVHTLDWLNLDGLLGYAGKRVGPPQRSRLALAQAFVAKAVLGFEQTSQLRSQLLVDTMLRQLQVHTGLIALLDLPNFKPAQADALREALCSYTSMKSSLVLQKSNLAGVH